MINNKVIVIGCNHQNTLGLVRSLGEKGIHPYCILLKSKDGLVFRSKYPRSCYWVENQETGIKYIINNFSGEKKKPILLTGDDTIETLFDKYSSELRKNFIVPASNEDGKITYLMDKQNIGKYAAQFGFMIPKMIILKKNEAVPDNIIYPVFTKSLKSIDGGKREEKKCNNKEDLQSVLNICKGDGLLVQQFIDKIDEIDYIGYTANGEIYIPYVQHQLRFSDHAYGGYHRFDKVVDNDILKRIKEMVLSIKFQGLFSVEFLVDRSGEWYFTEINYRHDGHAYLITAAGVNLPYLYCKAVLGENTELQPNMICESFKGMNEIVDLSQFVITKKISWLKWIWQFITVDTRILWNIKDNGPVWYMVKQYLLKKK